MAPTRPATVSTAGLVMLAFALQGCAGTSLSSAEGIVIAETIVTAAPTTIATTTTTTSSTTTTTTVAETTTTTLPEVPRVVLEVAAMSEPLIAVGTADGAETARLQERLLELGFWVQSTDGDFGVTTRQAVMAAQKYYGLPTTSAVDEETAVLLSSLTERPFGRTQAGTVVEVDKSRQLAFFVNNGVTEWVLNVSTGSEIAYEEPNQRDPSKIERGDSITDPGLFKVDREREEGWWDGDLGSIYRPKYFNGGIAVHGSYSIPDYPASHGCVRVSTAAMDWIWDQDLMPMGTPVWVHGEIPA
ncbi:MAG: L,D-transpeptidase family protein [Actinomycetota bacterium]|nr:L,D-transpeptidase family protein [Actinomycetota bacterium]